MLKKIYKPSMLLLVGAVVLFAGVCVGFGVVGNLGYINYHPMDAIFRNLGYINYHPMDIIVRYIPNIL